MRVKSGFVRDGQIVIEVPQARTKDLPRTGTGEVIMNTYGMNEARAAAKVIPRSLRIRLEETAQDFATRLQQTLHDALLAEYTRKSATGRFARSIRVGVVKQTKGDLVTTSVQVKAIAYRETKFLTALGGGYFITKPYPVEPYRIYARGAQKALDFVSATSARGIIRGVKGARGNKSVGRLKVPRPTAFFTAGRKPGRGGGETRFINDALGPKDPEDLMGVFFFYPLWVDHPGFRRDLLSELALRAGSQYQQEVARGVGSLPAKVLVPSGNITIKRERASAKIVTMRIPEIMFKRVR